MIQLKRESIQSINVTVRDTTGYISDLSSSLPTFDVYSVDPVTDANVTKLISGEKATATGLDINCVLSPLYVNLPTGVPGWGIANNAPTLTLPYTVVATVNDRYNIPSIFFGEQIVPPGTYNTYQQVAVAMSQALGQFTEAASYYYRLDDDFGDFTWDSNLGRFRFDGTPGSSVGTDSALNGLTISTGGGRDMLAVTGWTDGQIFFDHAVRISYAGGTSYAGIPLVAGRYRMYVNFETPNAQIPRVGPVEFVVV